MVTLAITTYNRDLLTLGSFKYVLGDDRINEIVIVDDCSDERYYNSLKEMLKDLDKVKLYRNPKNLGCYHNKRRAVELSSNEWVILFDSDNVLGKDYLDSLFIPQIFNLMEENVIYAPSFAKPNFDYRIFSGHTIDKQTIKQHIDIKNFDCLINTCNFVVNREQYLKVFDQGKEEPWTADTLYFNYCWLKAGNSIYVVPGMEYEHLVHEGSHYKEHVQKTGNFATEVMDRLRQL